MKRTYLGLLLVGAVIFGGVLLYGYMEQRHRLREFQEGMFVVSYPGPHDGEALERVRSAVEARPGLKEAADRGRWQERRTALSQEYARLRELTDRGQKIDVLLTGKYLPSKEASEEADELHEISRELARATGPMRTGILALEKEVKDAIFVTEERPALLEKAREKRRLVEQLFTADLDGQVRQAIAGWPAHRMYLEAELTRCRVARETMNTRLSQLEESAGSAPGSTDADAFRSLVTLTEALHVNTSAMVKSLRENVQDLGYAVSHVLIDAEKRGAIPFENIRIMRVAESGTLTTREEWRQVTELAFDRDIEHLGMTIYHKPRGALYGTPGPAGPAGFEFVGDDSLGEWSEGGNGDPGEATWRFRKRAAGLAGMVAGGAVLRSRWKAYRKALAAGRTYFGKDGSRSGTRALLGKPQFNRSRLARSYVLYRAQKLSRGSSRTSGSHRGSGSSGYRGSSGRSYGK